MLGHPSQPRSGCSPLGRSPSPLAHVLLHTIDRIGRHLNLLWATNRLIAYDPDHSHDHNNNHDDDCGRDFNSILHNATSFLCAMGTNAHTVGTRHAPRFASVMWRELQSPTYGRRALSRHTVLRSSPPMRSLRDLCHVQMLVFA